MTSGVPLSLTVVGASGRTGSLVVSAAEEQQTEWRLRGALVSSSSSKLNTICLPSSPHRAEVLLFSDQLVEAISVSDVVIDFSTPESCLKAVSACVAFRIPILVATTGLTDIQREELSQAAASIPILVAPNTSLAVFVLHEISLHAAKIFGDDYDIEIMEIHHRHKKDAPSGTALALASSLAEQRNLNIKSSREGRHSLREKSDLSVAALRGGDVPGEHTVFFLGDGERLEITQRARDRSVFARGALFLAKKLRTKPPGLYSVRDLFI